MIKKIVLIALFVLFAGVLIYGAVNRTTVKSETAGRIAVQNQTANAPSPNTSEHEQRNGQSSQGQGNQDQRNQGQGGSNGQGNQGQGGGNGQGQGRNQQREAADRQEQIRIEGIVIQAPAYGIDMILETTAGDVLIGTGPGYLAEQGFLIVSGDSLSVAGVWENDEFKAATITQMDDGTSIILRDEWGRPMWSGAGRNAQNRQNNQSSG